MYRNHLLIKSLIISAAMALTACGGSSDSTPSSSGSTTISGSFKTPSGTISHFQDSKPIMLAVLDFIVSQSMAAITGLTGVPNATVELVRINDDGSQNGGVLASTTTDSDGNYTLSLPSGVEPSANLVVQVKGTTETLRAVVSTSTGAVNIDPVSEFILDSLINKDVVLSQVNVESVQVLVEEVAALDLDLSGTSLEQAETLISNDSTVSSTIDAQVTAAANATLINGAWQLGSTGPSNGEMLVFSPNGFYLVYQVDAQDCPNGGVEYGTYTYDGTNLSMTATLDENGQCGLVGEGASTADYPTTIDNNDNRINLTDNESTTSFNRVTDGNANSIVGGWEVGGSVSDPLAIVFYENGNYAHWQGPSGDSNCTPGGVEYGTYVLDGTTLSVNITADQNSDCGLGEGPGSEIFGDTQSGASITVSNNVWTATETVENNIETFSANRLETSDGSGLTETSTPVNDGGGSSPSQIVGAWDLGSSIADGQMLVFYPNGFYLNYSVDAQDCSSGGVEYGTYTYDGTQLDVTATLDENGQCGLVGLGPELPQYNATITNEGNQINLTSGNPEDGTASFARVTDGNPDSIVGGWDVGGSTTTPLAIVFYPNGNYAHWQDDSSDSNCSPGGPEYGTYSYDAISNTITGVALADPNDCGIAPGTIGPFTAENVSVANNVIQFIDFEIFSADRLETSDGSGPTITLVE